MKITISTLILVCLFFAFANAQVKVTLEVNNQTIDGDDLLFDIYLNTTNGTSGNLFLGNTDLVIQFNEANYNNPVFSKEGASPGFCTLKPTNSTTTNDLATQSNYYNNMATLIIGDELIINLNGPTPSDQNVFDNNVATVDEADNTHRLGRFRLSGILNPNEDMLLNWKTEGVGLVTKVHEFQNSGLFLSSKIELLCLNTNIQPITTTIKELDTALEIKLYPNPVKGLLYSDIRFHQPLDFVNMAIVNMEGQLMKQQYISTFSSRITSWNISDLSAGNYMFLIWNNNHFTSRKFLLQKE